MSKGERCYLKKAREGYLIRMLMVIIGIFLALFLRRFCPEWLAKYLTILAGVLIVPFSLYLTKYVTIFPYRSCKALEALLEDKPFLREIVLVDLLLVPVKRTYHLLGVACLGNEIHIYTKDRRLTKKEVAVIYKKRGIDVRCYIYNDHQLFVDMIKEKREMNQDHSNILIQKSL